MIKRKHLSVAAIVLVLIVSSSFAPVKKDTKKVKNIILMIGDGMGMTQMYAAYTVNNSWLNMLTMPFIGMSKTNSIDDYITDSAAGGTALSCGCLLYTSRCV